MATDNTPPRLKLIVTIAIISVVTLVSLDFIFRSYYAAMTDAAHAEKIAPTRDRDDQMKAEQLAFTQAAVPVDQAIAQLSRGGRPAAITPQASDDVGAITGWNKLPKPAPQPLTPQAPGSMATSGDSDGGANLAAVDAGAHPTGDAGARPAPHGADAGSGAPRH